MKVIRWISRRESEKYKKSIGGLGGWFNAGYIHEDQKDQKGQRWKDFIEIWKEEVRPYFEAIRESVLEKRIKMTGEEHQYGLDGIPLFEDNTVGCFSFRAWGDLMAAIWSEKENKDYTYMDFYV